MVEMNIDVRIAFQNLIWNRYKITVPNFEKLLDAYLLRSGKIAPAQVKDLNHFLSSGLSMYLEPVRGFICSKTYDKDVLKKAGFELIVKGPSEWHTKYQDQKSGTWWTDVEGKYGELVGQEFKLLGLDCIEGLEEGRKYKAHICPSDQLFSVQLD